MDGWIINNPTEAQIAACKEASDYLLSCYEKDYNIIIADEILYAVQLGLLQEEDILNLIDKKPQDIELILTGSHQPLEKIFEKAHLVTEVKKQKHPYDSGFAARRGVDY